MSSSPTSPKLVYQKYFSPVGEAGDIPNCMLAGCELRLEGCCRGWLDVLPCSPGSPGSPGYPSDEETPFGQSRNSSASQKTIGRAAGDQASGITGEAEATETVRTPGGVGSNAKILMGTLVFVVA